MAREISWGDRDFIYTLDAENWQRNPHRQSSVPDNNPKTSSNGKEDSRGFCQLHRAWHSDVVDNPLFRENPKRQLEQCWYKYKNWTRFYGYDVRHKVKERFALIE